MQQNNATVPTDRQLIDALNLVCDYAMRRIAPGWQIELTIASDESCLTLYDADGTQYDVVPETGQSMIRDMCDRSIEQ